MKILFISHDATRTGAPIVLLNLINWLKAQNTNIEIEILLMRGGVLEQVFNELGKVFYLKFKKEIWNQLARGISKLIPSVDLLNWKQKIVSRRLKNRNFDIIYGNTVLAADAFKLLNLSGGKILHIHELNYVAKYYGNFKTLKKVLPKLDKIIAVSEPVKLFIEKQFTVENSKIEVIYPFSATLSSNEKQDLAIDHFLSDAFIVGGCGTIDWRKGTDLFIQVAKKVIADNKEIHFLWLGGSLENKNYYQIEQDLRKLDLIENVHFVGSQPNPQDYFEKFDLFLMTSREDPFPLVCLENAQAGNPIICFKGATGSEIFINNETGRVVPYMDTQAMANAVLDYYQDNNLRKIAGEKIKQAVSRYTIENSGKQILRILKELKAKKG